MKVSSLLVSSFLALSSGHYVDEEQHNEPPQNHVRTNIIKTYDEAGPRFVHDEVHQQQLAKESNLQSNSDASRHVFPKMMKLKEERSPKYDVLIVGAGAAGLSAAHMFDHEGWKYKVLEAHASEIGGRTRNSNKFGTEFNIDLGGEWLHTTTAKVAKPSDMLKHMVKQTLSPKYDTTYTKREPKMLTYLPSKRKEEYHSPLEYRWAGGMSWHSFITQEVAYKEVRDNVINGCVVSNIKYKGKGVTVKCGKTTYRARHVIVTVPMKMLQKNSITFNPPLPKTYKKAIKSFNIPDGFKLWLEFDKKWYPDYLMTDMDRPSYKNSWEVKSNEAANKAGYRLFWNEMYPYKTKRNILGCSVYGDKAKLYKGKSDKQIREDILQHLSPYMNGAKFTGNYLLQNWSTEPFIESTYTIFADGDHQWQLQQPLPGRKNPKLSFAGEAITYDWGSVHTAAKSGRDQAQKVMKNSRPR